MTEKEKIKFSFPRTIYADKNCLYEQIQHIKSEVAELESAYLNETIERVAEELADLHGSVETAYHIVDDNYVSMADVEILVERKNRARGYYS